jgi:hypothetical protein
MQEITLMLSIKLHFKFSAAKGKNHVHKYGIILNLLFELIFINQKFSVCFHFAIKNLIRLSKKAKKNSIK